MAIIATIINVIDCSQVDGVTVSGWVVAGGYDRPFGIAVIAFRELWGGKFYNWEYDSWSLAKIYIYLITLLNLLIECN